MQVVVRYVRGRGKKPNWRNAAKEVERTIDAELKPRIVAYAEKFVADWDHKPEFKATKRVTPHEIVLSLNAVGPNKKYFVWTSRGTKKHRIRPKRKGGVLAFPTAYAPHTRPPGPSYGGPGTSSGKTVFAKEVNHPGTRPRHIEEAIGRWIKQTKTWSKGIENAIKRGLRK